MPSCLLGDGRSSLPFGHSAVERAKHKALQALRVDAQADPIYRSEARYVVVLQSPDYPKRIWTKFESDNFRERFGAGAVIPIRYTTVLPGFFTEDAKYGGMPFDPSGDMQAQGQTIATVLCRRIVEDRQSAWAAEAEESVESSAQEPILPGMR
jgi:hypothetical protein